MRKAACTNPAAQSKRFHAERKAGEAKARDRKHNLRYGAPIVSDSGDLVGRVVGAKTTASRIAGLLSMATAAELFCGGTQKPMTNLKRRIKAGTVDTVDVDGDTFVVPPKS